MVKALGLASNPRANLRPQSELETAADSLCHRADRALRLAALRFGTLSPCDPATLRTDGATPRDRLPVASVQLFEDLEHALLVKGHEIVLHQAVLRGHHAVRELRQVFARHAILMQRLLGQQLVDELLQLVVDHGIVASEYLRDEVIHRGNLAIGLDLHVIAQHAGEHRVVRFAVRHVVFASQLVAEGVHGSAAARFEAQSRVVRGDEEVAHQFVALGAAFR